jgi:hypothetical protein
MLHFFFLETEIPGALVSAMVVDRFGRRLSMASMLFTSCVFLFPLVFSRTELLTRISLFGARLCIAASFTIIYIYAPEVSTVLEHFFFHPTAHLDNQFVFALNIFSYALALPFRFTQPLSEQQASASRAR